MKNAKKIYDMGQVILGIGSLMYLAELMSKGALVLTLPISCIYVVALVMMRWSGYAAIHAVFGGLFFTALSGGSWQHFVIYGAGNLLSLAALVMFRIWDKERIRKDAILALVFALCTQLLMQLGRAGVAALLGFPAAACLGFITTDSLSALFTLFVIWIIRRIEGLFEDQKHYLLRIQSEQKVERGEQF